MRRFILMHMRTTLNIDDALSVRATELSGLSEKQRSSVPASRPLLPRRARDASRLLGGLIGAFGLCGGAVRRVGAMILVDTSVWVDHFPDG